MGGELTGGRALGGRRASIHDVARHAGVSAATVSKVLHGNRTVRPENTERVHASIRALNYRVDPLASNLRRARRGIIGAVVPDFESPFFGAIIAELEVLAERKGFALAATSSRETVERERGLIGRMHDWRVAGLVVAPVHNDQAPAEQIASLGLDAVFIDRVAGNGQFDVVTADGTLASAAVARRLVEAGHRHVLVVTLAEQAASLQVGRLDRFRAEARALDPEVRIDAIHARYDVAGLTESVNAYFATGQRPTAIYCLFLRASSVMLGAIRARGWRIPADVSLVGFDDADWMRVFDPPIAAVVQPVKAIARRAMERLFQRIDGDTSPVAASLEICEVLMRPSVGPPPGG